MEDDSIDMEDDLKMTDSIDMGDDSIDMVILDIDMGYLVTLATVAALNTGLAHVPDHPRTCWCPPDLLPAAQTLFLPPAPPGILIRATAAFLEAVYESAMSHPEKEDKYSVDVPWIWPVRRARRISCSPFN